MIYGRQNYSNVAVCNISLVSDEFVIAPLAIMIYGRQNYSNVAVCNISLVSDEFCSIIYSMQSIIGFRFPTKYIVW